MSDTVGVALGQFPVGFDVKENERSILEAIAAAEPGDVVVTPEGSLSGYPREPEEVPLLDSVDADGVTRAVERLAVVVAERGVDLVAGACVLGPHGWENLALILRADGTRHEYRKLNLARFEREAFRAGGDLRPFSLGPPGAEASVGVQLCREVRFPEQWVALALQGAQVFLHPTNGVGDEAAREVWQAMVVARAAELQRYVVSVSAADPAQICPSMAVAPDGRVLARIPPGTPANERVELDLRRIGDVYLGERRTDLEAVSGGAQAGRS